MPLSASAVVQALRAEQRRRHSRGVLPRWCGVLRGECERWLDYAVARGAGFGRYRRAPR